MKKQHLVGCLLLVLVVLIVSGCTRPETTQELPTISGKHIILIIAPEDYNYQELYETKTVLESAKGEVLVASISTTPARSSTGETYTPDLTVENLSLVGIDAVVFIGGPGMQQYFEHPEFLALAQNASSHGKIVGAICVSPVILANAGVLIGKNATVFPSYVSDIQGKGALFIDQPVVRDGKIVTGNDPNAAKAFGQQLVQVIAEEI